MQMTTFPWPRVSSETFPTNDYKPRSWNVVNWEIKHKYSNPIAFLLAFHGIVYATKISGFCFFFSPETLFFPNKRKLVVFLLLYVKGTWIVSGFSCLVTIPPILMAPEFPFIELPLPFRAIWWSWKSWHVLPTEGMKGAVLHFHLQTQFLNRTSLPSPWVPNPLLKLDSNWWPQSKPSEPLCIFSDQLPGQNLVLSQIHIFPSKHMRIS